MEQLLSKSAPVALSYLPLAPKRAGRPPIFFSFFYSLMIIGSMCAISDFLLLNEKTVEWCERTLTAFEHTNANHRFKVVGLIVADKSALFQ